MKRSGRAETPLKRNRKCYGNRETIKLLQLQLNGSTYTSDPAHHSATGMNNTKSAKKTTINGLYQRKYRKFSGIHCKTMQRL